MLLFPGNTIRIGDRIFPYAKEVEYSVFFLIKARCSCCAAEYLLFDKDFHGWDGFVCHDIRKAATVRPALEPWRCLSCGESNHSVTMEFSYAESEKLEEDLAEFRIENPADAFEWVSMTIRCERCDLVTEKWVDYETA